MTTTTEMRDPQFAKHVAAIASASSWPSPSFHLTLFEAVIGTAAVFGRALATPDPVMLQHALRGIAF